MGELHLDYSEFMIRNGLRISEAAALEFDDIDFSHKTMIIDERLITSGRTIKNYVTNPTKTVSSNRVVDLDDRSIELIRNRLYANHKR